jgi:hypothetical protein
MTARRRREPPTMHQWSQQDICAIRLTKEGDVGPLADRLRGDADLSSELRQFAADIIEGKFKRPPYPQKHLSTLVERLCIATRVDQLADELVKAKGENRKKTRRGYQKQVVPDVANKFGCGQRKVGDAIAQAKKFYKELKSKCDPDEKMPAEVAFPLMCEIAEGLNRLKLSSAKKK